MDTHLPPTVDALQREARAQLAHEDADALLLHVLACTRAWVFAHGADPVDAEVAARLRALVARRVAGEPVAYLTGHRGFWTLDLAVTPDTLIPRADTERLVELALERLPADGARAVADLGTGSGAIALAVAQARPRASVVATDRSAGALDVARANAATHALANVTFLEGDWFAPLAGRRFDLVASNPPYIASGDPHLATGDLRFEPASALASGVDGLDDLRAIVRSAPDHLVPGGWLLLEHGHDQGAAVRALLDAAGFVDVATASDVEDRDRIAIGRRPH